MDKIKEIKAEIYDEMVRIEMSQRKIQQLNQLIAELIRQNHKPEEVKA